MADRLCGQCEAPIGAGAPAKTVYCSSACRQAAYRYRRRPEDARATQWSRRVQQVSVAVPMDDLTAEQVEWLGGAADYLRNYCRGVLRLRGWTVDGEGLRAP